MSTEIAMTKERYENVMQREVEIWFEYTQNKGLCQTKNGEKHSQRIVDLKGMGDAYVHQLL